MRYNVRLPLIAEEDYFRFVVSLRYPSRCFKSVKLWQTDVEQN